MTLHRPSHAGAAHEVDEARAAAYDLGVHPETAEPMRTVKHLLAYGDVRRARNELFHGAAAGARAKVEAWIGLFAQIAADRLIDPSAIRDEIRAAPIDQVRQWHESFTGHAERIAMAREYLRSQRPFRDLHWTKKFAPDLMREARSALQRARPAAERDWRYCEQILLALEERLAAAAGVEATRPEVDESVTDLQISEDRLVEWAHDDPARLLGLIVGGRLDPADVALAAEVAGRECETPEVVDVLLALLEHPSPVAREGAIYGLYRHAASRPEIVSRLQARTSPASEASAAVREVAAETLRFIGQ